MLGWFRKLVQGLRAVPKATRKPNIVRKDGTYWCSSYNPDLHPMIGLFDRERAYYLIEVKRTAGVLWVPTGIVWEGECLFKGGFTVL